MYNRYSGTIYFKIVNIGDDIGQNRFMSHLMTYVLNKYPNISNFQKLSIIDATTRLWTMVITKVLTEVDDPI